MIWNVKSAETTRVGRFEVVLENVEFSPGYVAPYSYVKFRSKGVCILPVLDGKEVLFVRQYRRAIQSICIEAPAGMINENELPSEAARRELLEETGLTADHLVDCGSIFTSPGSTDEVIYLFIAHCSSKKRSDQQLDPSESIECIQYSLEDARILMERSELRHNAAQILLCRYLLSRGLE